MSRGLSASMPEPTLRLETGPSGLDACFADRRDGARRLRIRIRVLLAALGAASLGTLLALAPRSLPDEPIALPEAPPRRPDWVDLLRAPADIQLAGETGRDSRGHGVQQHEPGGGRRDVLSIQGAAGDFRIVVYRPGQEYRGAVSFHLDMVRLAAGAGFAVVASGQGIQLATRLGPFEASEIRLSGDRIERNCTGFRSSLERDGQRLLVSGFSCASGADAPERSVTACRINRLEASATAPQEIRRLLGPAPRKGCEPSRSAAATSPDAGG